MLVRSWPTPYCLSLQTSVTVRPCQLNEYVDPGTNDLCVECGQGTYNLQPTNTICDACPSGAVCSDPCLGTMQCADKSFEAAGFLVPMDGFWHPSMFSDQVG